MNKRDRTVRRNDGVTGRSIHVKTKRGHYKIIPNAKCVRPAIGDGKLVEEYIGLQGVEGTTRVVAAVYA